MSVTFDFFGGNIRFVIDELYPVNLHECYIHVHCSLTCPLSIVHWHVHCLLSIVRWHVHCSLTYPLSIVRWHVHCLLSIDMSIVHCSLTCPLSIVHCSLTCPLSIVRWQETSNQVPSCLNDLNTPRVLCQKTWALLCALSVNIQTSWTVVVGAMSYLCYCKKV